MGQAQPRVCHQRGPRRACGELRVQALSSARVGTPPRRGTLRGGTGVGVGHELRNEASVDPRMVTIPRAEEEPVQVAKLRTGGGAEYSSTPPTPGAQGCRLGCRLRQRPHLHEHPWEGTSVSQGESHLNAWPSRDAHRDFPPSSWGAPVTASATHTPPTPAQALAHSAHRPWNENSAIAKTIGIIVPTLNRSEKSREDHSPRSGGHLKHRPSLAKHFTKEATHGIPL